MGRGQKVMKKWKNKQLNVISNHKSLSLYLFYNIASKKGFDMFFMKCLYAGSKWV